jgi:hypothetical protein
MLQLIAHQQMTDGGDIGRAQLQCLANRSLQLRIAKLAPHANQCNHGPRSALATMPQTHRLPQPIVTGWPSSLSPPLCQRLGAAQCAWLAFQHFQIVFQIQHLLCPAIAPLVLRDPLAVIAELHQA